MAARFIQAALPTYQRLEQAPSNQLIIDEIPDYKTIDLRTGLIDVRGVVWRRVALHGGAGRGTIGQATGPSSFASLPASSMCGTLRQLHAR